MPAVIVQIKQWINYSGWMFLWCVAFPVFSVRDGGNQTYGVSLPAKDDQVLLFHEQSVGDEGLHSTGSGGLPSGLINGREVSAGPSWHSRAREVGHLEHDSAGCAFQERPCYEPDF